MTASNIDNPSYNPPRDNPDGVYVYHDADKGISLGVELDKGKVTGALAVCSPKDNFSKKKAQFILRERLRTKRLKFLTFDLGDYQGNSFRSDVFTPLMDYIRDEGGSFSPYFKDPLFKSSVDRKGTLAALVAILKRTRTAVSA